MLVIDEIHSVLAGTFREQRIILNAIRFLANDLRIPLVRIPVMWATDYGDVGQSRSEATLVVF
jgi:hypothetical protein